MKKLSKIVALLLAGALTRPSCNSGGALEHGSQES